MFLVNEEVNSDSSNGALKSAKASNDTAIVQSGQEPSSFEDEKVGDEAMKKEIHMEAEDDGKLKENQEKGR